MRRNHVYTLVLVFILIGVLGLVAKFPEVEATIYINPDGSINPPTANITTVDNVNYIFTGNVNDTIWVQRDNITIDGADHTLRGAGSGTGIYLYGTSNVTIKNVHIENFSYGIYIYESSNNTVITSNITTNDHHGIYVRSSTYSNITENHIANNDKDGIYLLYSSNNSISGNNMAGNEAGVHIDSSTHNHIFENNMTDNGGMQEGGGIWIDGAGLNTISGNNITANTWHGLDLDGAYNNTISQNKIEANTNRGIMLQYSNYNNITGNYIINNYKGIEVASSSYYNTISGNNITANDNEGISIDYSSNNTISGNNIINNDSGITLWDSSNNNSIAENTIADGWNAITLGENSANNSVSGNNITNNYGGIAIKYCSNNTLRSNTIISTVGYDFGILATSLPHFLNDVDDSNTIQGKPIYYWINRNDSTVPSDASYVVLVNCTNISIQNVNISRNSQGVIFAQTTNATIAESNITDTQYCIWLWNSSNCHINENYVSQFIGIQLDYSSYNTVYGNTITGCGNWGSIGIYLSYNNTFYHNNFTDNYRHVLTDTDSINNWDNGYPEGGNYWDDFKDHYPHVNDVYSGAYQNETGSDGFWDGPYTIDANNTDHYPIVPEYPSTIILSLFMVLSIIVAVSTRKKVLKKPMT
jgi:parallel beta-helix repeat protein